jgi:hypothetical protein
MLRDLTISVDDTLYAALQPMVEQRTIGALLMEFVHARRSAPPPESAKKALGIDRFFGALPHLDTSNIRGEEDRAL